MATPSFRFSRIENSDCYEILMKRRIYMKNFICICSIFAVGFVSGSLFDSYQMANDKDFHDYWMKRCKKN